MVSFKTQKYSILSDILSGYGKDFFGGKSNSALALRMVRDIKLYSGNIWVDEEAKTLF
jgi:hypothetical protein